MRKINEIIIHCSATEAGHDFTAHDIDLWHRQRGFHCIGYHYVIRLDGTIEQGRPEDVIGAHCLGHNAHSIGICYIGGLLHGKPFDTRTIKQKAALKLLVERLKKKYPDAKVIGHRDTGAKKACPCFDAIPEFSMYVLAFLLMLLLSSCRSPKTMTTSQSTTDSVKLTTKDSTTNHISFTFDSLIFSTTDFTDYTDKAAIPSGRLSVKSVLSVVNKNLPCSRLVVYGGKLSSNSIHSVSQDSTSNKTSQETKINKIRSDPLSPFTLTISLLILSLLIFFFYKIRSKVLS